MIYDYFSEFASEALHIVIFENFVKSMTPCLSKLKVKPSFCFTFKIPDNVTASRKQYNEHSTHILPFGIFHFLLYQLFLPDRHCGHPQVFFFFGLSLYGLFFGLFCSLLGHHLTLPLGNFNPTGIMAGDLQRFSISLYLSLSPPWRKPAYPVARLYYVHKIYHVN